MTSPYLFAIESAQQSARYHIEVNDRLVRMVRDMAAREKRGQKRFRFAVFVSFVWVVIAAWGWLR